MNQGKKLTISILTLVVLCLSLCVTSFALGMTVYEVKNNYFKTGGIDIDLNGGDPILMADEQLFEPGKTVESTFYVQNNGQWDVYYKLYFSQVSGDLGNVLDVSILNEQNEVLLSGKMASLTEQDVPALEDQLKAREKRELKVRIHYPKDEGNEYQGHSVTFQLSTIAVQTINNVNKEFH